MEEQKQYLIRNIVVEATRVQENIEVEVSTTKKIAKHGDWVVTFKTGKKIIVKARDFEKNYMSLKQ